VTPRCSPQPHTVAVRPAAAHNTDRLEQELKRLRRYKLLVIDEFGYLAFDHDAAHLFFQLVAARYEQGSILVTSNMPSAGAVRSSPMTSSPPR
jgi:DNA replication protein DnaC